MLGTVADLPMKGAHVAEIQKVMYDDHHRVERFFRRYRHQPTHDMAMTICDEIDLMVTIQEELTYPILQQVSAGGLETIQRNHDRLRDMVAEISEYEPGDPAVQPAMRKLEKAFGTAVVQVERECFPAIKRLPREELGAIGSSAFALRQELMAQLEGRPRLRPAALGLPADLNAGVPANPGW